MTAQYVIRVRGAAGSLEDLIRDLTVRDKMQPKELPLLEKAKALLDEVAKELGEV
jgi:hypothetical protein